MSFIDKEGKRSVTGYEEEKTKGTRIVGFNDKVVFVDGDKSFQ